jgi:hypothetical protein
MGIRSRSSCSTAFRRSSTRTRIITAYMVTFRSVSQRRNRPRVWCSDCATGFSSTFRRALRDLTVRRRDLRGPRKSSRLGRSCSTLRRPWHHRRANADRQRLLIPNRSNGVSSRPRQA